MASAGELDYYRSQSWVTEPGATVVRFGSPPDGIAGIKAAAHCLVTHYRADRPLEHGVAPERMSEIDTRYAAACSSVLPTSMAPRLAPLAKRRDV